MPRQRGAARVSGPRRRIYRIKTKWTHFAVPRRFKLLIFDLKTGSVDELKFEIEVLLWLEHMIFEILQNDLMPEAVWNYYMGFAKRLWERAVKFAYQTFQLEKTSLKNEYVFRGLALDVLEDLQADIENAALWKRLRYFPLFPPVWAYSPLTGQIWLADPSGESGGSYSPFVAYFGLADPSGESGGSYANIPGAIGLADPSDSNGGSYCNRY